MAAISTPTRRTDGDPVRHATRKQLRGSSLLLAGRFVPLDFLTQAVPLVGPNHIVMPSFFPERLPRQGLLETQREVRCS